MPHPCRQPQNHGLRGFFAHRNGVPCRVHSCVSCRVELPKLLTSDGKLACHRNGVLRAIDGLTTAFHAAAADFVAAPRHSMPLQRTSYDGILCRCCSAARTSYHGILCRCRCSGLRTTAFYAAAADFVEGGRCSYYELAQGTYGTTHSSISSPRNRVSSRSLMTAFYAVGLRTNGTFAAVGESLPPQSRDPGPRTLRHCPNHGVRDCGIEGRGMKSAATAADDSKQGQIPCSAAAVGRCSTATAADAAELGLCGTSFRRHGMPQPCSVAAELCSAAAIVRQRPSSSVSMECRYLSL